MGPVAVRGRSKDASPLPSRAGRVALLAYVPLHGRCSQSVLLVAPGQALFGGRHFVAWVNGCRWTPTGSAWGWDFRVQLAAELRGILFSSVLQSARLRLRSSAPFGGTRYGVAQLTCGLRSRSPAPACVAVPRDLRRFRLWWGFPPHPPVWLFLIPIVQPPEGMLRPHTGGVLYIPSFSLFGSPLRLPSSRASLETVRRVVFGASASVAEGRGEVSGATSGCQLPDSRRTSPMEKTRM